MYCKCYSVHCCVRIWQLNAVYIENILFCINLVWETIENWILSFFLPQSNPVRLGKSLRVLSCILHSQRA